jgi:hypothetical protein
MQFFGSANDLEAQQGSVQRVQAPTMPVNFPLLIWWRWWLSLQKVTGHYCSHSPLAARLQSALLPWSHTVASAGRHTSLVRPSEESGQPIKRLQRHHRQVDNEPVDLRG